MAVVNIPITHKAVDWWRGLHQEKTIFGNVDPDMKGLQLFTAYRPDLVPRAVLLAADRFRVAWLAERAAASASTPPCDAGPSGPSVERRRCA